MVVNPRIVVLGAGSVGCFIGGAWAAKGLHVSFIGRTPIAEEVKANGLRLSALDGKPLSVPADAIEFSTKPAALAKADIVLLCVKSNDTANAARQIAMHAKRNPTVISCQNGVSNPDVLKKALPKFDIIPAVVSFNIVHQGPGRWHKSVSGELYLADRPIAHDLEARIPSGLGAPKIAKDIQSFAWGKLLLNLNNAVNALSGRTLLEELRERDYRRVLAAAMLEALELFRIAKITPAQMGPIPPNLLPHAVAAPDLIFNNMLLRIQNIDPSARSSMLDDLEAGRPSEVDALNGEVVRLAERLGRDAPVNRALVDLVRQREAGVEHIWSPGQLREYVLEGHRGVAIFGY